MGPEKFAMPPACLVAEKGTLATAPWGIPVLEEDPTENFLFRGNG